ncbi:hypothetical protein D3C76_1492020 [compost metagenome]
MGLAPDVQDVAALSEAHVELQGLRRQLLVHVTEHVPGAGDADAGPGEGTLRIGVEDRMQLVEKAKAARGG